MHRIAATPGGWTPDTEGTILIEQTPASIVLLTAADTDIQTLAASLSHLPPDFPSLRAVNLLQLQQQLSIDHYADTVLSQAQVIILRLLGGRSYWSYGLEVVKETVAESGASLFILPGDDRPDPEMLGHSTVSLTAVHQLWRYFVEGGSKNWVNGLKFASDLCLGTSYSPISPQAVPRVGLYHWRRESVGRWGDGEMGRVDREEIPAKKFSSPGIKETSCSTPHTLHPTPPKVGLLFYRAHYLAGNTLAVDAICQALFNKNLDPIPVFISSLRDPEIHEDLCLYFQPKRETSIQLLLNTTSFSLAKIQEGDSTEENLQLWQQLNVPVLQVILSSSTQEQWQSSWQGLTPRDVAMNVALPEVDGRIITRAVSFKAVKTWNATLESEVVGYQPQRDRVEFIAALAANWMRLQNTPKAQRKIALILANYPNRDGRIANGVGLDTPASCLEILRALQREGYQVDPIPETGEELIQQLTAGITNDLESREIRPVYQQLSLQEYQDYFATLPESIREAIHQRWGDIESLNRDLDHNSTPANFLNTHEQSLPPSPRHRVTASLSPLASESGNRYDFPVPGIQLGNIFVGIQPSRGYDRDPSLNYHAPDLEPTHDYLAYYCWLREKFGALAMIHLGKHGNLEWLPGKSLALSDTCYPEIALGTLPNFYPFIVNDPGEGSQAKRRSHAVILDHLTPPLTRAQLYGELEKLETLIDEYYEAQSLDPSRLKTIGDRITQLVTQSNLNKDLGIENLEAKSIAQFLTVADGYLCELKEAQIRDGLHIFGQCPRGRQLRDLTVAIARSPSFNRLGLTCAIARDFALDFHPLTTDPATPLSEIAAGRGKDAEMNDSADLYERLKTCRTVGGAIEVLEEYAAALVEVLIDHPQAPLPFQDGFLSKELAWIRHTLLPALQRTPQEIVHLLGGLDGKYVPSGASGAPTRGRPEVLPTGRNFYSVDIRAIPTETAWDVGRKAAEAIIERYTQENGEYPKTLAISIWGTSTMRTGGDDVAQVLALLGVQPIWDGSSRRVVGVETLAPSVLGRPRVDVTVRVSGFFRDSFPNILQLLYQAINEVSSLNEEKEINPLAAQVRSETAFWQAQGLEERQAQARASYRIFGSKPGAYGAGLQGLIEAQNWQDDRDLARAYINWSSYAYDREMIGHAVPEVFEQRLGQLQIVLHNQDNREHDLLDSDDYYQFQGGLTAAVRAITGKNPHTYFGDNSISTNPKVRLLREEIARVYRSRVINPKWIAGVMRHGYKGAFEMAATVDYLFAYDATARCVEDFMYQGVADAYLFDEKVQNFIEAKNPWVLRDMAERLLEANQRGLWPSASEETLEKLRGIVYQVEGFIEGLGD